MRLKRAVACVVLAGVIGSGCAQLQAETPVSPIEPPPVVCEIEVYGNVLGCEQADTLRIVVTVWWLRWYGYWAAAARYATAVYHARQQASIHDHPWLTCIRVRESGGNYSVYNTTGSGASGAYQFMPGTWAWMSRQAGYGAWAGSPAASAPPHVQDAVAYWAYAHGYQSHWVTAGPGGC